MLHGLRFGNDDRHSSCIHIFSKTEAGYPRFVDEQATKWINASGDVENYSETQELYKCGSRHTTVISDNCYFYVSCPDEALMKQVADHLKIEF